MLDILDPLLRSLHTHLFFRHFLDANWFFEHAEALEARKQAFGPTPAQLENKVPVSKAKTAPWWVGATEVDFVRARSEVQRRKPPGPSICQDLDGPKLKFVSEVFDAALTKQASEGDPGGIIAWATERFFPDRVSIPQHPFTRRHPRANPMIGDPGVERMRSFAAYSGANSSLDPFQWFIHYERISEGFLFGQAAAIMQSFYDHDPPEGFVQFGEEQSGGTRITRSRLMPIAMSRS